ncbi:MAG: hypothetical protein JNL53_02135 [Cyclobacteriaceae bacterium]|nr:hypothetical protein [Cyclobacteriaceae bacterium]
MKIGFKVLNRYILGSLFSFILISRLLAYVDRYNEGLLVDAYLTISPVAFLVLISLLMYLTLMENRAAAKVLAVVLCLVVLSRIFSYIQFHISGVSATSVIVTALHLLTVGYLYLAAIRKVSST